MGEVFLNGSMVSEEEAKVSVMDRGFLFGDGLFETLLASGSNVAFWTLHYRRLARGCRFLGIRLVDEIELRKAVARVARANAGRGPLLVRITVTRGIGGGMTVEPDQVPTVLVSSRPASPLSKADFEKGWRLTVANIQRGGLFPGREMVKSVSYVSSILAADYARCVGSDEALMLNEKGYVTEGSRTNLFAVIGGRLVTPSLREGVLPGVTRQVMLGLSEKICGGCDELSLKIRQLLAADEMFVTGTGCGVMPVTVFDDEPVASGSPGTLTRILAAAYEAKLKAELGEAEWTLKK